LASAPHASQCLVGQRLRDLGVRWVTLDPSTSVMAEADPDRLAQALRNADAFLPSEKQVRAFFQREALDIWDMAEQLGEMGSRFVVIKRGANGQAIYDHQSGSRWQVPAYPARVQDVTGAGHSYAGGFLSGLVQTQDPIEAGLRGAVSASMVVEGSGALYALHAMPGLADARLESLRQSTHRL
jgi:sugar/nucleoside kinase (ribokinase family)